MKPLSLCAAFFFFLMDWLPAAPAHAQTPAQAPTPTRTMTGQVLDASSRRPQPMTF